MDFIEDITWQGDPAVTVSDITTQGNYALTVNGAFNAASLNINGTDINNIFINAADLKNNIDSDYLIVNSNITTSNILIKNSLTQSGVENINFKGDLFTAGDINIGLNTDKNKKLFVGGTVISSSNITSNIDSININNSGFFTNVGDANIIGKLNALAISSNGIILNFNNYITSNLLYDFYYTNEGLYPPKNFNDANSTIITTFLNKSVYYDTITLNTDNINYGSGTYIIYSSSISDDQDKRKINLFTDNIYDLCSWKNNNYLSNGYYANTNYIKDNYLGDWIIIKLPKPIILTKFIFTSENITNAPSLWRCYGSFDGVYFTEIIDASNDNIPLDIPNYTNKSYTKILSNFNILYDYIGFTFNKIIGVNSGRINLILNELKLYGKEIKNINPTYISSNTLLNNILPSYSTTGNDPNYLKISGGSILEEATFSGTLKTNNFISNSNILTNYLNVSNVSTFSNSIMQLSKNPNIFLGNIGIGSTDNNYKLYVNGQVYINSNLFISNDLISYGNIKENNIFLSNIYISSNVLINTFIPSNNIITSNYASNISNVIITNTSNYASNVSNVIITNTSNYASNVSNVIITNTSNYASNISNVIITNTSNYASNISNVLLNSLNTNINNASNYASNVSNVIITNTSNYASNISNVIITNTSNYASNVSNVIITNTSNYASNVSNVIITNTSNYASNVSNVIITNTSNYASNVSNVIITNTSNYASNISNVIITNTSNYASNVSNVLLNSLNTNINNASNYASNVSNVIITNTSNYAFNISNVIITNTSNYVSNVSNVLLNSLNTNINNASNYASNVSNVIITNTSNYASNISNVIITNTSNYASNISNVIIVNTSNYASNISNVIITNTSNYASNVSNVIITNTSNYASNVSNVIITNTSNYASNVSNVIIRNTSNYASNVSNVIITNTSNYASNISNVIITNTSNYASNVSNVIIRNTSNYASNVSNVIIRNTSNYASNVSNVLLNSLNTNINNASNYASNVSNIIITNTSNYASNVSNVIITNTSNYASNISNVIITNTSNYASNVSNVIITNTSNYASNVSNVIITNTSNYASNVSNVIITNTSNYASNVSNVIIVNTSNYASNVSNVIITNTSNYASNVSNIIITNTSNYASNVSNVIITNTSNYASNISNVIITNTSNYASNISNVIITNTSNYASNVSNVIITNTSNYASNISNVIIANTSNYASNVSNVIINSLNTNISNLYSSDIIFYTQERRYPPKALIGTSENTITLLGQLVNRETLNLNTTSISYGSGNYEVYSSSTLGTANLKSKLFNYSTNDSGYPRWAENQYISDTGNYAGESTIDNFYKGDWVIIKLPQPIMLTRYRIYQRSDSSSYPPKAPSEWKVYGSNDGITFTEITEASQMTRLTSYTNGFYEKSFNSLLTIQYQYIGFVFGKLLSVSGNTGLLISELQIFGKEAQIPYYISSNIFSEILTPSIINTSNYASNVSNVIVTNTSNYASNVSNVIINSLNANINNTSNYASNVSNVLLKNFNNFVSSINIFNNSTKLYNITSTTNAIDLSRCYVVFNYTDEIFIDSGTYDITFEPLSYKINTTPEIINYSYPLLKDTITNTTIQPLIWYKFETYQYDPLNYDSTEYDNYFNKKYLFDDGSLLNGSLILLGTNDTITLLGNEPPIRGSASFTNTNKWYKLPNIKFYSIYQTSGITFNFGYLQNSNTNIRTVFEFGNETNNISNNISVITNESINREPILTFTITDNNIITQYTYTYQNFDDDPINVSWSIDKDGNWNIMINMIILANVINKKIPEGINDYLNMNNYIGRKISGNDTFSSGIAIFYFKVYNYCLNFNDNILLIYNDSTKSHWLNYLKPIIFYIFNDEIYRSINYGSLDIGVLTLSAAKVAPMRYHEISNINKNGIVINNSYVVIPNNTIDLYSVNIITGISFSFWVKVITCVDGSIIFNFGETLESNNIMISITSPSSLIFELNFKINDVSYTTSIGNNFIYNWTHIIWTISIDGVWKIYINGNKLTDVAITRLITNIPTKTNRLYYIGRALSSATPKIIMKMTDFRIYNKILEQADVNELYSGRIEIYKKINVGIGTTNPLYSLDINGNAKITGNTNLNKINIFEEIGTDATSDGGSLTLSHNNPNGISSIVFKSYNAKIALYEYKLTNDYAYIKYVDNIYGGIYDYFNINLDIPNPPNLPDYTTLNALVIGTEPDITYDTSQDNLILIPSGNVVIAPKNNITYISGNVGIGITNPDIYQLNVNGSINLISLYSNAILIDFNSYALKSELNIININTSNYASNISNVIISNNSNFTLGTSNILRNLININLFNSSNYASNISNIIITNNSNFTLGTSNTLRDLINTNLSNNSNFTLGTSNTLRDLININLSNNSNFTLGTSNTLRDLININLSNSSNYASNISNIIITNNSNYASNISNIIITNNSNYASNISNIIITNNSNYASNISNVLISSINNNIYTTTYYLSSERQYPPLKYNSSVSEIITFTDIKNINPINSLKETLTVNSGLLYGNGNYILYSSSYTTSGRKEKIFDFEKADNSSIFWNSDNYTATGECNNNNYIKSDYLGDWFIIKLPVPIILTKFIFYNSSTFSVAAPGTWKCYGSVNGDTFNEITQGSQSTKITYNSGFYTKILDNTFDTKYYYIGWCINSLAGNFTALLFKELEIFGKEEITLTIPTYISSNALFNSILPQYSLTSEIITSITNSSNYASNVSNVIITNTSNYASNVSNVIITNTSNYASNVSNVIIRNTSNYASNVSNVIITNTSNYASNISNVIITNTSNYASNISNVIIRNTSNYASNVSNVIITNTSNYASNVSNVIITNTSNYASNVSNVIITNTSNYASNVSNVLLNSLNTNINNTSNYASNVSNVIITNTSNYASNISNVIIRNTSNYASNISNVIITNTSNYASNISNVIITNTSNYASNVSNVIITNTSNYASNVSNVLLNSLNTNINNTSNYASNVSNVIITNTSNYASNVSNVIITNTSNYASNISNVIIRNTSNYASNISNVIITNTSNYASNISNVIITNTSNYASNVSNIIITNTSNYASNVSNVIIRNTSNYASNVSNVIITNTSNYASNVSNIIITNTSNYASNVSNIIITNTSNYASNVSNVIITNTSNYASNVSNVIITNTSNYASNVSNVIIRNIDNNFLKLSGGNIMTGGLRFNNILANKVISLYDNATPNNHQFVGIGANNGLILNTYNISDVFQFRVGLTSSTSTELMRLTGTGNLGIGTTDTSIYKLNVNGSLNATSISSNGILIDFSNYVTSNQLYGKIEKQYPPRIYDISTTTTTPSIFGKTDVITETITLNNGEYGAGDYIIYSSSSTSGKNKNYLFNYIINDNNSGGWNNDNYLTNGSFKSSLTSYYINETNYLGDWIIIKFPSEIILSKINIYPYLTSISRNPSSWRCYGSTNGEIFNIISLACNDISPLTADDYKKGYYEKIIPETFTQPYLYIGFVFNKIIGGDASETCLMFVELQIFGRDTTQSALYLTSLFNKNLLYYSTTGNDPTYISSNILLNTILPLYSKTSEIITSNINTSNYSSNVSNVIITNTSNYASNVSNVIITNTSNYASNVSNVIITNTSNYASNVSNVIIRNTSNYASNISNVIIRNTSNYASNVSNVIITNTSNYASNVSNVIITNTSNYASNVSNVIITNTSNYASNVSNVIITNTSNYASNISNVIIRNTSNYASNVSNVIITNTSNYASNVSNVIITNTSNYASNVSNVIITNTSNYASNVSNVIITNTSNYASNVSNVIITNTSNYASNVSNVIIRNTSNYASNISNVIITNTSNYASNVSNVIIRNTSNYASNISNVIITNTSNYASNVSNVLLSNINNIKELFLYTSERPYPPKAYNNSTNETTTTFLGKNVYTQTIYLNTDSISYGSGDYIIYSSSIYTSGIQTQLRKRDLFNFATEETGGHWDNSYNLSSGYYTFTPVNYIKNDYNGDWIIIKLPKAIILTKFRFVHRTSYVSQAPSLWRCYGSNDGINFTEITEAFNDIVANALTSTSYNANKIYEKSLNETFKTSYQYIGFTFNKTISNEYLCFAELQLFGKELYNFQSELAAIALGTNSSNYASNISNVIIINSSNFTSGTGTNTSNYASNISNVIITNSSNFTSGTGTNTSNYASNISNIIITNNSNFTLGTGTNTSNYASNISNVIIINNSNFTLGTGTNTSNYASNVSNVIINSLNTNINNTSNYASNVSNVIIRNTSNYASNISNVIITNTSNYASNVSNVIITDINNNYLKLSGGTLSGNLNVSANITTQQLYINNQNLTASIFFSPNSSIYSIFSRKVPWAMYFAEDYNASSPNVLPNYISNGKDATLSGIEVIKTTTSGNGATGPITFISGTTGSTVLFPIGSIPSTFTILSLTRYTGPNKQRILDGSAPPSYYWLHGHWQGISGSAKRGKAYYHAWITDESSSEGNIDDWLCMIGKNSGAAPGNILVDGIGKTTKTGGSGGNNFRLNINSVITNEKSDWALSCVMIWSEALTDAEMVDLNTIINNYKNDGISIKSLINSTVDDDSVIESRVYNSSEKTELLLFKGNDVTGAANGPDRIRLKAGNIAFDTYSTITSSSSRNDENIVMLINENGYVGIGTTNPSQILQVGAGGRLRISNGASDYSLIGTIDTEGVTNTRIILSGNTRTSSPFAGDIQYYATTAIGEHLFYVNETNILTLSSTTMTTSSNIDCGGGIAITGSTAFNQQSLVESSNQTNTYINFKSAGSGNDWCYLRQIGTSENYKLALDFHDDIDARFCIRSITSTSNTDVINEVFTVDNGNTIINGLVNIYTGTRYAVINNKMQPGSLTIGGIDVNYGGGVSQWTTTNVAGLLMECLNNTEIAVHDAGERVASLMYYEGNTTNRITIGRDMGWGAISNVNINGILQIGGTNINNYLFNNNGVSHLSFNNFDNIDKFGYTFIVGSTNGPGTDTQYYSWYIGLGSDYSSFSGTKSFGMQFAIGRYEDFPKLSVRRKQVGNWTSWQGLTAERAVELTSGNKTITGNLTVSSILTTSSNINCGGGIAITGSTAIHDTCNINLENMQSTYISFAPSTSVDDFCYLRQIGTSDNYKLAFDFHDNIDARFCIRSITSTNTPDTITEVFTVDNGNVTCTGNIDCGGGIAITGSTAFNQATLVDTGNKANTYINFKSADGGSDWCYLRQIGTGEYKLALDFHDDGNDARFCIRNVLSYVPGSDTVSEVFAIDNGIVSCSSNINTTNKLICNNTQVAAPAQGIFGGNGDRIILYPGTASAHPYSFGINASELWYRTPPGASHKFYINETAYLTVNNTGATVNGSLNASSLQESGKNISTIYDKITDRQLSINNLANTYVSSNQLYNYTYTYSSAQVYPPKLYNSASVETITTYLSQSVYYQVMQLDTTGITYGSGTYEIYSSSSFDGVNTHNKGLLFNNTDEALTAAWKNNNYDTSNGTYIISNGKNINGYYGDWIIIKLPVSIILTSFRFYATFIYGTEKRSPGEWKCYGSVDGITYTEITEGSQMTRLVSSDYTTNGYYEKTLTPVIDTPYQYIGWVINKIVATSGQAFLHFSELKIYGKQVQPLLINDKYLSSNVLPNIQKKNGFQITCSTPITLNGTTYYKYDIDLTKYTQNSTLSDGTSSYRIFNINCFIASGYFNLLSNNLPRVFNYNVYMSNKTAAGDGPAGINICATGTPENFNLDKIPSNYVFLLRTNNYNYLSVVTTQSGVSVNCIIMDNLN